jgi:plasmid stabilization system protein ParE
MKYKLTILETAEHDMADAFDWYNMQSEFAAGYLVEKFDEAFKHIVESPLIYQKIHRNFRQIVLNPFPYVIIYLVKGDEVIIFRIWHTSRNPKNKFK